MQVVLPSQMVKRFSFGNCLLYVSPQKFLGTVFNHLQQLVHCKTKRAGVMSLDPSCALQIVPKVPRICGLTDCKQLPLYLPYNKWQVDNR